MTLASIFELDFTQNPSDRKYALLTEHPLNAVLKLDSKAGTDLRVSQLTTPFILWQFHFELEEYLLKHISLHSHHSSVCVVLAGDKTKPKPIEASYFSVMKHYTG